MIQAGFEVISVDHEVIQTIGSNRLTGLEFKGWAVVMLADCYKSTCFCNPSWIALRDFE